MVGRQEGVVADAFPDTDRTAPSSDRQQLAEREGFEPSEGASKDRLRCLETDSDLRKRPIRSDAVETVLLGPGPVDRTP